MFRVALKIRIFKSVSAHRVDALEIFIEMQIQGVECLLNERFHNFLSDRFSVFHRNSVGGFLPCTMADLIKSWRALGPQGVCVVNRAVALVVLSKKP